MMPHSLLYLKIHERAISCSGEIFGAADEIDALDNQLVIFLLRPLTWRCRLAHKVGFGKHQLHMKIDVSKNKTFFVKHVHVRATD